MDVLERLSATPLDPESERPLWAQLEARVVQLRETVDKPLLLPRENDVAQALGIARGTVRRAWQALREADAITSSRGRGTLLLPSCPTSSAWRLPSFSTTETVAAQGVPISTRVLSLRREEAPRIIAEWLELEPHGEVWEIQRLRTRGDRPGSLELSYVPVSVCAELNEEELAGSLYRLLAEKAGREAVSSHQRVSPAALDAREARLLQVEKGLPALRVLNTTYDREGLPFEGSLALLPGTTAWLDIRLSPEGDSVRRRM